MAADRHGATLARVAEIRGRRLTRAAVDARTTAEQAAAAAERAAAERAAAAAVRSEARAAFTASPACIQARVWLDRTIEREAGAIAELADRHARADLAQDAHGVAVRALARHEVRSETIAGHRQTLRRADQRRAEDRAEADAPMTLRPRIA
ncbi:hypothetical protein ACMGDH_02700 [Sphingomonas sp. DT-207]|uniref:hypothetical protein n=1 Tax=Sphingomonas sp. DT-207 TaxID=3396167 RepID=UPI003F1D8961